MRVYEYVVKRFHLKKSKYVLILVHICLVWMASHFLHRRGWFWFGKSQWQRICYCWLKFFSPRKSFFRESEENSTSLFAGGPDRGSITARFTRPNCKIAHKIVLYENITGAGGKNAEINKKKTGTWIVNNSISPSFVGATRAGKSPRPTQKFNHLKETFSFVSLI